MHEKTIKKQQHRHLNEDLPQHNRKSLKPLHATQYHALDRSISIVCKSFWDFERSQKSQIKRLILDELNLKYSAQRISIPQEDLTILEPLGLMILCAMPLCQTSSMSVSVCLLCQFATLVKWPEKSEKNDIGCQMAEKNGCTKIQT